MQQHPDVVPGDADFAAQIIFFAFFEKNRPEDGLVASGQFFKHLTHDTARVIRDDTAQSVGFPRDEALGRLLVQGFAPATGAEMLREHVVADGIHQWPEALRVANASRASQKLEAAGECLLLYIVHGLAGRQAGAHLQLNQFAEISNKMVFRLPVARSESLDISAVERLEVHVGFVYPLVSGCKCTPGESRNSSPSGAAA